MRRSERRLLRLIQKRSLKRGIFTLASGLESDYFIDIGMVSVHSEGAHLIGKALFRRIGGEVDAVGGLQVGAVPLVTATVARAHVKGRSLEGFSVRKEVKDHGTAKVIEGGLEGGVRVVILEDVATTGESAFKAVTVAREMRCRVLGVIALVDRLQGAEELFKKEKILFASVFTVDQILETEQLKV